MKIGEKSCIALLAHHKPSKYKAFRAFTRNLCVIACLIPSLVCADKLILGGVSHHAPSLGHKCPLNEKHPAIGLERSGWEYGAYYNSFKRTSFFVSKIDRPWQWKGLHFGYRVGLASGYGEPLTCENKEFTLYQSKVDDVVYYYAEQKDDLREEFDNYKGFIPQAQFIVSYGAKYTTLDFGIGLVSTLTFKLNL